MYAGGGGQSGTRHLLPEQSLRPLGVTGAEPRGAEGNTGDVSHFALRR